MTEYDSEPCPFCGLDIKLLPAHLPCEGVPDIEEAIDA